MAVKISPDYIDLLNKAVEREIQVSLQYILQHAKMEKLVRRTIPENILLEKTTYDAVGKILKEIAIQEMKHAATIIERIYYLGGQASTKSGKITIGDSLSEFAKLGVKAEEEALMLYRQIIETAGQMGDWETREVFEKKDTYSNCKNTQSSKMKKMNPAKYRFLNGEKSTPPTTLLS
jgi:bacterioferritin